MGRPLPLCAREKARCCSPQPDLDRTLDRRKVHGRSCATSALKRTVMVRSLCCPGRRVGALRGAAVAGT